MNTTLTGRLNQILPRITAEEFLSSEGIGNEIACYIFDYPAQEELVVREHIKRMISRFASHHSQLKVLHLNLLEVVLAYLSYRGLLDKTLKMEKLKGDVAVLRALKGPLAAERLRDFIADEYKPADHDLVLLSGVGSVWPMLRAHGLLNCLHTVMGHTPLVMFYPGTFDGTTLRLFGSIATNTSKPGTKPYYRAFILVPGETEA
jgi:BREX protein BrxB